MQKVILGEGLKVSPLGFGGWAIGGTDWGPVDDEESMEAVHTARGAGVDLFDTADFYGFGHGEAVIARALQGAPPGATLATKGGVRWDGAGENIRRDGSPAYLREAVEASLRRLKRERLDLYQLHWPDPEVPIAESVGALMTLKQEGKIGHVGVCNLSPAQLKEAAGEGPIACHQLPLSLLDRSAAEGLAASRALEIPVVAYSPLGMGILTGKYVAEQVFTENDVRGWFPYFRGEAFRSHIALTQALSNIAQGEGKTPGQVALRWVLETPGVAVVLVGARRAAQVHENLGALGWALSARAKERLGALKEAP